MNKTKLDTALSKGVNIEIQFSFFMKTVEY